jgi:hypothetical protein
VKKSVKLSNIYMPTAGDPSNTSNLKKGFGLENEAAYIELLTQQAIKKMTVDGLINVLAFNVN